MGKYILNLYKQFCGARGMTCNPFEFNKFLNEFIEWVANNKILTNKYKDFILTLDIEKEKIISEVGKGRYDSLKLANSKIISPYAETLGLKKSELFMLGSYPLIKKDNGIAMPSTDILLTHNPYEEMIIYDWVKIHNSHLYDISIGMYGNIHDSNFTEKIKLLEDMSKQMDSDYSLDYDTDKDNYFCAINSRRTTKRKILIR